ncbi:DMT family transporter [Aquamicrobium segne]|uniref:DMT family transporter n=1 Tax=Aquamicrobium segne TaxID=469547 RepID=A0ABW0H147_9HYPH
MNSHSSSTLLGISLMAAAMLLVPTLDGIAKMLSASYSPLLISWARYAFSCIFVLPWALLHRGRNFLPREELPAHALRTFFAAASMCCFFMAISFSPMADVTSAYFVGPIIAALLSVFILGEALTARKLAALVFGFIGALIIVNPAGGLNIGLLLGATAGGFFALYAITTRQASRASDPVSTLAFQCLFGTFILAPLAIWQWSLPSMDQLYLLFVMGAISAACHFMTISAFRHAEASLLAPLAYLELLSSVAVGYLMFNDLPGPRIGIGAMLIVAGGLILVQRRKMLQAY